MPGPYKRRSSDRIIIGPEVLEQRWELAAEIGLIASQWNDLELQLSRIFCALLLRQERMAFDIYHTIRGRDLRKQLLLAAGKGWLTDIQLERITKLYSDIRRAAPDRHRVIHGIWAITDRKGKENVLLGIDEKTFNENFSNYCRSCLDNLFEAAAEVARSGRRIEPKELQDMALKKSVEDYEDVSSFIQYSKRDFEIIRNRIGALRREASALAGSVLGTSVNIVGLNMLSRMQHRKASEATSGANTQRQ
jgi:hypothetical protein